MGAEEINGVDMEDDFEFFVSFTVAEVVVDDDALCNEDSARFLVSFVGPTGL